MFLTFQLDYFGIALDSRSTSRTHFFSTSIFCFSVCKKSSVYSCCSNAKFMYLFWLIKQSLCKEYLESRQSVVGDQNFDLAVGKKFSTKKAVVTKS